MKRLHSNIELYKELKELWNWLNLYVWMEYWKKAIEVANKIDKLKEGHEVINFFACLPSIL